MPKVPNKNQVHYGMYYIHTVYNVTSEVIKKRFKFSVRQDYLKDHPILHILSPEEWPHTCKQTL